MTTTVRKFEPFIPHLEFKSPGLRTKLQSVCDRVLKQFDQLPPLRLLCYFDDENPDLLQRQFGQFTCVHVPIIGSGKWPDYVEKFFFDSNWEPAFDNIIYMPATKYAEERVAFVIAFSHELQHFLQWGFARKVYQANVLLFQNLRSFEPTTNAKIWDIPSNREAMIVAKRVAEAVCSAKAVKQYMDAQINESDKSGNTSKRELWTFFRDLSPSSAYDLRKQTDLFVQKYKQQLLGLESKIDFSHSKWWL